MDGYRAGPRGPPEEFGGEKGGAPAGCFLGYSDTSFFTSNIITDITPYVQVGISSSKSTIIVYIVGALLLFLLILALFLWYRLYRKKAERGITIARLWRSETNAEHLSPSPISNIKWQPRSHGALKVNVDAAVTEGQNSFAIGMVFRNNQGQFLTGRIKRFAVEA
ncbi:hypothetical protein AgCh_039070 [Apium graveolens]